jgi:hypothetical protein
LDHEHNRLWEQAADRARLVVVPGGKLVVEQYLLFAVGIEGEVIVVFSAWL